MANESFFSFPAGKTNRVPHFYEGPSRHSHARAPHKVKERRTALRAVKTGGISTYREASKTFGMGLAPPLMDRFRDPDQFVFFPSGRETLGDLLFISSGYFLSSSGRLLAGQRVQSIFCSGVTVYENPSGRLEALLAILQLVSGMEG